MPLSEEDLVDSRGFLSDVGVWPEPMRMNMSGWLSNFDSGGDRQMALALLESFVHVNEPQIIHGTISAIRALSTRPEFGPAESRQDAWEAFIDRAYISFPSGSGTDVTGSGHIFARILKEAGFVESRIRSSDEFVAILAKGQPSLTVVFLDDVAATGTQFARTWNRQVSTPVGKYSLADLAKSGKLERAYYAPIAATQDALDWIAKKAPAVVVQPVYLIETDYYASTPTTRLVPAEMWQDLPSFVSRYSPMSGNDADGAFGFGGLGLEISFHHSIPNNTLPILQKNSPSTPEHWKALTT